ncbi:hypothetical protein LINGRAHAP2_LOCUS17888 [Linum grandiflorum]
MKIRSKVTKQQRYVGRKSRCCCWNTIFCLCSTASWTWTEKEDSAVSDINGYSNNCKKEKGKLCFNISSGVFE